MRTSSIITKTVSAVALVAIAGTALASSCPDEKKAEAETRLVKVESAPKAECAAATECRAAPEATTTVELVGFDGSEKHEMEPAELHEDLAHAEAVHVAHPHDGGEIRTIKFNANGKEIKIVVKNGQAKAWIDGEEVSPEELHEKLDGMKLDLRFDEGGLGLRAPEPPKAPAAPAPSRGVIGITISDLDGERAQTIGVRGGAVIQSVREGLPADKAGLKTGEVIVRLNGERVGGTDELVAAARNVKAGEKVLVVVVDEDGDRRRVELTAAPEGGVVAPRFPEPVRGEARWRERAEAELDQGRARAAEAEKRVRSMVRRLEGDGVAVVIDPEEIEKAFGDFEFEMEDAFDEEKLQRLGLRAEELARKIEAQARQGARLRFEGREPGMFFVRPDGENQKFVIELEQKAKELEARARKFEAEAEAWAEKFEGEAEGWAEQLEARIEALEGEFEGRIEALEAELEAQMETMLESFESLFEDLEHQIEAAIEQALGQAMRNPNAQQG